jgi:AcrR family transcriptional regulator
VTPAATTRRTAEERRETVLEAAIKEFAENGYFAARTAGIAERAGISQPYIYALFPNKRELFLAAHRAVHDRLRDGFIAAARGGGSVDERLERMGQAYYEFLGDRDNLLMQLQGHAAAAANPELREEIRSCFVDVRDEIARASGAGEDRVREFLATGMLLNVVAALDLDKADAVGPEDG